jgi:hypothetical protein
MLRFVEEIPGTVPQGRDSGGRRHAELVGAAGLADWIALVAGVEEELILEDRAAYAAAEEIVVEAGILGGARRVTDGVKGIDRVHVAAMEVLVDAAVELVGAGADDGVEMTGVRVTEFGRVDVGGERKLSDGIGIDQNHGTADGLVVVVDAFEGKVVALRALASNGRTRAARPRLRLPYTRTEPGPITVAFEMAPPSEPDPFPKFIEGKTA